VAKSLDQTGVMQVNGAWATRVQYEAAMSGARAGTLELRFMQGRAEIARLSLAADQVTETLGAKNGNAIARHLATDANKYLETVRGELRGRQLHYGEISLPGAALRVEENSIGLARERDPSPEPKPKKPEPSVHTAPADEPKREEPPLQGSPRPDGAGAPPRRHAMPAHIAAKYLVKDDRYHFDDQTVAFIDQGSRLTVKTHNTAVIKDLVEIAQARGWQSLSVTGTKSFRREAWREAYAAGLAVSGYSPTGIERAAADRDRERRSMAREPSAPRDASSPSAPSEPGTVAAARNAARPVTNPAQGIVYGTLIEHGVAPYRNDEKNTASYYVTLQDEAGVKRTHWGVGLEAALLRAESRPALGDRVGLARIGSTPVTVMARTPGADGVTVAQPIDTKRHQWRIEKEEFLRGQVDAKNEASTPTPSDARATVSARPPEAPTVVPGGALTREQEVAAAIRSAETTREELQLKYPELNKAVFQHLASHEQFAEAYVKAGLIRETDRAQVIAQMRERLAAQLEQGKPVREPDNKQVNTLIRRSVNRVAADIGRPVVEVRTPSVESLASPKPLVREEAQVRA